MMGATADMGQAIRNASSKPRGRDLFFGRPGDLVGRRMVAGRFSSIDPNFCARQRANYVTSFAA